MTTDAAPTAYVDTWAPVDLTAVLNGDWAPAVPTVGSRNDGIGLFYPGKVHTISSESEGGKTWLALTAAATELIAGRAVVYVDFEDDEGGVASRLLALQVPAATIAHRFTYLRPLEPLGTGARRDQLGAALRDLQPTLAVIDGITEAMTVHGLDPLDNKGVATFGRLLPRFVAGHGPAVVCLDHVTKDREGRGRYAIGGVHKLNGLDGAAYLLENRHAFGVGVTGRSTLLLAKDRPGQLRRHAKPTTGGRGLHWFADLELTSHTTSWTEASIEPPTERPAGDFLPTTLMGRVSDALQRADEPLSLRGVLDRVTGKNEDIRRAIAALIDTGHITTTKGDRNSTLHTLTTPYPPPGK